jgi:hypothetical protein
MWKMIPTPNGFWKPGCEMDTLTPPPSGTTSTPLTESDGEAELTLFMADFPVKTCQPQDAEPDLMERVLASGGKCLDAFGKWDQSTSSLRTFQASLFSDKPGQWLESFPPSGTMRNGTCYRLPELVPRTSAGGGGASHMPTPRAQEPGRTNVGYGASLNDLVNGTRPDKFSDWPGHIPSPTARFPTPQTTDAPDGGGPPVKNANTTQWNGANSLGQMAKQGLWPTPNARPGGCALDGGSNRPNDLEEQLGGAGGQLNPDFVEWLMGIPQGWTSLEPLPPEHWQRWLTEDHWANGEWPGVPRVATGVKDRVNRLKMCGNGIVPAQAARFLAT